MYVSIAEREGIKEGIKKVAWKMKSMGMPVDTITEATGLSEEEIENIAEEDVAEDDSE